MIAALKRLSDRLWPPCPAGGHRQRGGLITIASGREFCWHPACRRAALAATAGCHHYFEPEDAAAGFVYERCLGCGAHRIFDPKALLDVA